jgi:uncharacterized protein YjiS (DUF1127 family)
MSAISFPGLSQVRQGFAQWRQQTLMHHELLGLGDRYREDMGLRRSAGDYRPLTPFRMM